MIDQTLLMVVAIACFSSVAFIVLRRFLDRRLALTGPDTADPTPVPTPNLAQRLDHSFAAMVHGTGMPLSVGQTLGLFCHGRPRHDDAGIFLA